MRRFALGSLIATLLTVVTAGCASSGGHRIVGEFADIGDLVIRANVQQSDAVVGTVTKIALVDRAGSWIARVEMRLEKDTAIPDGTTAVVRATSLLGEKYIDLEAPAAIGNDLPDGAVIPITRTGKAPELEDLLSRLGGILQGGALEDLARLSTAGAMILEGQEENVGRVLDQTAKLARSLRRERDARAAGLAGLASASRTLEKGVDPLDRFLESSDDALRLLADQRDEVEQLVVDLDRLAGPLADLTRSHSDDVDAQVRALRKVVPKLYEARGVLADAVEKLPAFTKLFAEATPGDYVQLDINLQAVPLSLAPGSGTSMAELLLEATR